MAGRRSKFPDTQNFAVRNFALGCLKSYKIFVWALVEIFKISSLPYLNSKSSLQFEYLQLQTIWQYLGTVVNYPDFVNALIQPYKDEVITPQLPHNTYLNYVHGTQARW